MNAEQFYQGLSDKEKLTVIEFALPGIDVFLVDILAGENLSEEGEKIRLSFVELLKNYGPSSRLSLEENALKNIPVETFQEISAEVCTELSRSDNGDLSCTRGYGAATEQGHWSEKPTAIEEKEDNSPLPCRKGTDSTEESGIFLRSRSLSQSDATTCTDTLNLPMLDSVDAWSRETIISESGSADYEVLDWESDANGNEEGYFTGDNVFVDYTVQKLDLQPNEFGELHSGVMYIREQPGWHKRWFTINDHCLKCYRHRSESKMLFEFPLKGAKIIPTDRKKSRMFPITLSVPRIRESITFATTEEHSRQEWIYILNYVISRLVEDDNSPDGLDSPNAVPLDSYFTGEHVDGESTHILPNAERSRLSVEVLLEEQEPDRRRKRSGCLDVPKVVVPCGSWTGSNEHIDAVDDSLAQWSIRVDDEDEMPVMDTSLSPEMDEDESFRELQELLPEIIQGHKISNSGGKKKKNIFRALSSGNVNSLGSEEKETSPSQKSVLSTSSSEGRSSSVSDLQSASTKVKRHSSLANALSTKAMRVKSRITGSFFKKGRKDDAKSHRDLASFQSTTFSGYLLRKKGPQWKNRWCVVKEHALFCYKDFGIGTAELEVPLLGASITTLQDENEAEKPYMFVLNSDNEELLFAAENDAELEEWIMVLEEEIKLTEESSSAAIESPLNLASPPSPKEARSESSVLDSPKLNHDDTKTKASHKKSKVSSPTGTKKTSILSSIGHKLTKSKPKPVPAATLAVPSVVESVSGSVEDGFVLVEHASNTQTNSGSSPVVDKRSVDRLSVADPSLSMEGFLNQRVEKDTWLKCWVKLENHSLHIHDEKDSADSVVVKFKLSNCVVKDSGDEEKPHVMEIRRALGRPLFLQAQSESEYNQWISSISGSIITTPKVTRRPVPTQSSTEDERLGRPPGTPLLKTTGDSLDRDEVFHKIEESQTSPLRPNTPLNPSPRPSTAGDVSNSESDDGESAGQVVPQSDGVVKFRSFSEGEQKTKSKLHRSISNKIPDFTHFPGIRKRRSRTVPSIHVSPDLLINVRHSSCLYLRNSTGLWTKRWCVLQEDKLHLFRRPEEVVPALSLPVKSCEVRRANKKAKKFSFEVNVPSEEEEYCFAADSEKEMMTWIQLLRVIAEEECTEESSTKDTSQKYTNNNGDAIHDVQETGDQVIEVKENGDESMETETGVSDMRVSGESPLVSDKTDGSPQQSRETVSVITKPTSLDGVLKLLQDQQLAQQLGQQKFIRTKKAQSAWQRSAAAALKEQRARPEETTEPATHETAVNEQKRRTLSMTQTSPVESANDIIEQFEKLADEEKLKSLKNETLLRKRRNSLTLEKDVLKKKMTKGHERKSTVKKLLGKDESTSKEEKERAEQRLQKVNQELATIERDLTNNKRQEVEALDNLNTMKTKSVRKFSLMTDSTTRNKSEQKRIAFKNSPSESTSSQGSTEEKSGKESPKTQPLAFDAARKQNAAVSLAVLEKELRKISPVGGRRVTVAGEPKHCRVSFSSEGSQDDFASKDSPILGAKRVSMSSESSDKDQSSSFPKTKFTDSAELRRKRFSGSNSQCAFRSLSVEIPTDDENKQVDEPETTGDAPAQRLSVSSEKGATEAESRRLSVNSEKGAESGGHRASLMNALSQIKDFEEFVTSYQN